ncbi:hypothetical protein GGS20DRAFT_536065 [Poronia punctata]|nr:hypothetical protein GGS20DRAFT_536065 [Poronia punctata]
MTSLMEYKPPTTPSLTSAANVAHWRMNLQSPEEMLYGENEHMDYNISRRAPSKSVGQQRLPPIREWFSDLFERQNALLAGRVPELHSRLGSPTKTKKPVDAVSSPEYTHSDYQSSHKQRRLEGQSSPRGSRQIPRALGETTSALYPERREREHDYPSRPGSAHARPSVEGLTSNNLFAGSPASNRNLWSFHPGHTMEGDSPPSGYRANRPERADIAPNTPYHAPGGRYNRYRPRADHVNGNTHLFMATHYAHHNTPYYVNGFGTGADQDDKPRRRRGNLPKEATQALHGWFRAHIKHPYPTEEQKKDLARLTNLNLNQISNWFINARRRQLPNMIKDARTEKAATQSQGGDGRPRSPTERAGYDNEAGFSSDDGGYDFDEASSNGSGRDTGQMSAGGSCKKSRSPSA